MSFSSFKNIESFHNFAFNQVWEYSALFTSIRICVQLYSPYQTFGVCCFLIVPQHQVIEISQNLGLAGQKSYA